MARTRRDIADPLLQDIERALGLGEDTDAETSFSFAVGLGMVAERIGGLAAADPARAASLLETLIAGCRVKAEDVDDSTGGFRRFVHQTACSWIRARQAAGAGPKETARRLLDWIEDDPFALFHEFEKEALQVLDVAALAELVRQARARFDAATRRRSSSRRRDSGPSLDRARSQWGGLLRTLYAARQDVDGYVAIATETGLTPEDCLRIAQLLAAGDACARALEWVDRGIGIAGGSFDFFYITGAQRLAAFRRDLLVKLGRRAEALASAWSEYSERPSRDRYDELMRFVPGRQRKAWHRQAMDAAQGSGLETLMELLPATGETGRLADLVRGTTDAKLENVSHFFAEPAAMALQEAHPAVAARVWRAQGLRIVNAAKSLYYGNAVSDFENARRCFRRAGAAAEWSRTVAWVREHHRRKRSFMPAFEAMVARSGARHGRSK